MLLCAKEVAALLKVHERTAVRLMDAGEVPGFRIGRMWRSTKGDIEAYIARKMAPSRKRLKLETA